jgi:hypothetical protein
VKSRGFDDMQRTIPKTVRIGCDQQQPYLSH